MTEEDKKFFTEQFDKINKRLDKIENRLTNVEGGLKGIGKRLDSIEDILGKIQGDVIKNIEDIREIKDHLSMP